MPGSPAALVTVMIARLCNAENKGSVAGARGTERDADAGTTAVHNGRARAEHARRRDPTTFPSVDTAPHEHDRIFQAKIIYQFNHSLEYFCSRGRPEHPLSWVLSCPHDPLGCLSELTCAQRLYTSLKCAREPAVCC